MDVVVSCLNCFSCFVKLLFCWWESRGRRWKSKNIGVAKRYVYVDGELFLFKEVEGKEKKREFWGSCGCCWFKKEKRKKKKKREEREAVFQTKKKWWGNLVMVWVV